MRAGVKRGILLLFGLALLVDAHAQTRPGAATSVPTSSVPANPAPVPAATTPGAGVAAPAGAAAQAATSSGSPAGADAAASRNIAGTMAVVDTGATVVAPDKSTRVPKVGEKIYEGDAVVTRDGEVHIDMADGGYIAIRPNTAMRIAQYQANGDSDDKSVIGLLKGSFRSITGFIGRTNPHNYAVLTPTATIGVRGTDHEPAYVPEGTPGQDAGTYDNVHVGGTTIANAAGKVDVTPDHAGFVDYRRNVAPRVLDHVPTFFQTPHAHDNLLVGKHDRVVATLDQRRTQRIQEHQQELHNRPLSRDAARPEGGAAAAAARARETQAHQPLTREAAVREQQVAREQAARGGLQGREAARPGVLPGLGNHNAAPLTPAGRAGDPFEQMRANMAARRDAAVAAQQAGAAGRAGLPQQAAGAAGRPAVVPPVQRPLPARPAATDPNKKREPN